MKDNTPRPMTQDEQRRALADIYALFLQRARHDAEQDLLSEPPADDAGDDAQQDEGAE